MKIEGKKLRITRDQLVEAVKAGTQRELVRNALREVGLDDCTDCAERLLARVEQLKVKFKAPRG